MQKRLLWIIIIAAAIIAIAAPFAIHETSKPEFCNTCHSMKPYVAAWEKSYHAKTDCMSCHRDPGFVGLMKVKLGGLRQVAVELTQKPEPAEIKGKGEVPNRRCESCHKLNELSGPTAITFSHELHAGKNNIECVTCHGDLVHGTPKVLKMQDCLDCHKEKNGPTKCESCHQDKATMKPQNHDAKWLAAHGTEAKKDLASCTTCHTGDLGQEKYCNSCHNGVQMPHPDGWAKNHKVSDVKVCNTCHEKPVEGGKAQTCISCHQVEMPHPANWTSTHGKFTLQNKNVNCYSCHTKTECSSCHKIDMPHPATWLSTHGKTALAKGTSSCYGSCHTKATCDSCHKVPMPHSSSFKITTHGATALAKGSSTCYTCHSKTECSSCHNNVNPHDSGFFAKHSSEYAQNPAKCNTCHTNKTTCNSCHSKIGHTENWLTRHGLAVGQYGSELCVTCHDRIKFCSRCHQ
ncbi:NapC/NirT family cytochrome c [Carboxydothermus ferrireducens]|uniref:Nitrate/TMAO reductase-like tetraheme cytochrome c subunit n=1 Tax=Carboxydothermus ferrireducens DSM 11255 TaxID=1119529 RepID=A0ABX2RBA8_9THEO|nr:NapC/NirT family cytochrome c [Carboxydothermus ferrireducens]NYE57358.1 nitrate/TMAO reductase-like tetraheme cytochrome c subunit [Carboxydothermus ferrireducens DSM 11255]